MNIEKYIKDYEIVNCLIRDKNNICLVCQKWEVDDPLVPHETIVLTCNFSNPEKYEWEMHEIGTTTGLNGCSTNRPDISWVFITDLGEVFVLKKNNGGWEENVGSRLFTLGVKCIDNGFAFSIGNKIHIREDANNWIRIDEGIDRKARSFDDIDGFSKEEIYACGGYGELWKYQKGSWSNLELPTNLRVKYLCCGGDGNVYIVTRDKKGIFKGKDDRWDFIEKDNGKNELLGKITWFNDRLLLLTTKTIYEISDGEFKTFEIGQCHIKTTFSQIASTNETLVISNSKAVSMFDGKSWTKIL